MRSALPYVDGVECVHLDLRKGTVEVLCADTCDRTALLAALRTRGLDGTFRDGESGNAAAR